MNNDFTGKRQGPAMLGTPSWFQLQDFRVRYARFRPDQRLQPQAMRGRLCVFLAGSMKETLASEEHVFGENDVLYKPPEEKPRVRFGAKGAGTLTVEFDTPPGRLLGAVGFPADRPFVLNSPHCAAIARRMLREMTSPDALTLIALEGLTFQLFAEIMRRTHTPSRSVPTWLREVRERILDSADQSVRVKQLARIVDVHPVYLSQAFRVSYGESLSQFVRRTRVERAAMSLKETDKSMVQIAFESGFCDQSHFCRAFRNATGFPPGEFRRMFRRS